MSSHPTSLDQITQNVWFNKGFLEGVKVKQCGNATQPATDVSFELAEAKIQNQELLVKLQDTTDTLQELQGILKAILSTPTTETPARKSYADAVTLPKRSATARSLRPGGKPTYLLAIRLAEAGVQNYYSTEPSEEQRATLEAGLHCLLEMARSGDSERSFSLVKALCREAHGTRAEHRTIGQKRVLSHWRNPNSPTSSNQLINPVATDPPEVWLEYFTRYPKPLPKGVRLDPRTGEPVFKDIVASRLLAHLRPVLPMLRVEFFTNMAALFSQPGEYRKLVLRYNLKISPSTKKYFPFDNTSKADLARPITPVDIARHYASNGISVDEVESVIEPWAQEYAKSRQERF
ncbi:hypothetical protein BDP27DRAFT_1427523 [Rhodocollybia butyracea]|uniref:Uncharacterized protein n=1 Tax=Rhodocollybia butyracea TaxID=206335 RepID=A0A9P5PEU5_9AGAR|nr:hypothetical protein BDP27DRAFT_1428301 [Rhodocollybia butyracea]KAF9062837.1 hypothetical protein BDP27DRAFT_1427523 [Rhodocollybia butyracea]